MARRCPARRRRRDSLVLLGQDPLDPLETPGQAGQTVGPRRTSPIGSMR